MIRIYTFECPEATVRVAARGAGQARQRAMRLVSPGQKLTRLDNGVSTGLDARHGIEYRISGGYRGLFNGANVTPERHDSMAALEDLIAYERSRWQYIPDEELALMNCESVSLERRKGNATDEDLRRFAGIWNAQHISPVAVLSNESADGFMRVMLLESSE